jgi:hypothetical protein
LITWNWEGNCDSIVFSEEEGLRVKQEENLSKEQIVSLFLEEAQKERERTCIERVRGKARESSFSSIVSLCFWTSY